VSRRLLLDDGKSERELLVVGTMVVGRDPECEISSNDPRLSRRHAEFRTTPTGVVVRDLGSRNGVRVNGQPITEVVLAAGDVVSLAHLSMRFVDDTAPLAVAYRQALTAPMAVTAPTEDDRTRVAPHGGRPRVVAPPPAADIGEIVIRERAPSSGGESAVAPALPEELGVDALLARGWGRRVLAQGVLLAIVVFLVVAVPLLAWQSNARDAWGGTSGLLASAWPVLAPPLVASVVIGFVVAGRIARTAVRGARREGR
jgi:hypothetical protein